MQLKPDCLRWRPSYSLGDRRTDDERHQGGELLGDRDAGWGSAAMMVATITN